MVSCVVVDDDPETVSVFCEVLGMIGLDVIITGKNGQDAVKMYDEHHPDLIFVNLIMPEFDGFYAIKNILKDNPDAKIVVVTGDLMAGESYLMNTLKVTAVIYKPFDINIIKRMLSDVFFTN
ncbi:MAG: response regulator [Nitrosopumilus sp.]